MPDMYGSGDLTNQQKAAILFIAIGPEYSAKLFQHMDDDEIEHLTLEIANQKQVSSALKAEVIAESPREGAWHRQGTRAYQPSYDELAGAPVRLPAKNRPCAAA